MKIPIKLNPKFWFANKETIDIENIKRSINNSVEQEYAIYDYRINKAKDNYDDKTYLLLNTEKLKLQLKNNDITLYDFDLSILNLKYQLDSEKELDSYKLEKLQIDKQHNKIDELEYEIEKLKIIEKDNLQLEKKKLDILYSFNKIEKIEYLKQKATLNNESFVAVKPNFDDTSGDEFGIEIECNDLFIEKLKKQGYSGDTKDELLEEWLRYKVAYSFEGLDEILNNSSIPTKIQRYTVDDDGKKLYR